MKEHEFTLRFDTSARSEQTSVLLDRLAEHGCTDATVGVGIPGRLALMFSREANSAQEAVLSAVRDVRHALPRAVLVEASPDLVGISEVAAIVGRSRQNVRKLLVACRTAAPAPVHEGTSSLWHLATLLTWLRDEKRYRVDNDLLDLAATTMQLNIVAQEAGLSDGVNKEIRTLVSS